MGKHSDMRIYFCHIYAHSHTQTLHKVNVIGLLNVNVTEFKVSQRRSGLANGVFTSMFRVIDQF